MANETTTNVAGVGTGAPIVVGLFNDAGDAHQAVTQLRESGFSSNQIGAAFRGESVSSFTKHDEVGTVKHEAGNWWEKVKDAFRSDDDKVTTHTDVAADDSLEPDLYSRGEHEYDFAGDDFRGSLAGAGIPDDRAAYLTRSLRAGGAIVTVRDADRAAEAEAIISANRGQVRYEDSLEADAPGAGIVGTGAPEINSADFTGREITDPGNTDAVERVQLFGEVLRVHKERINRGEVRVHKDVITESQTIEVPVTREELVLERVPVSGTTPAPSASIGRGQEIRVPLTEETVHLEKQPVIREEVLVGKREVADVARVGDEVRHEELRVETDGAESVVTGGEVPGETRDRG